MGKSVPNMLQYHENCFASNNVLTKNSQGLANVETLLHIWTVACHFNVFCTYMCTYIMHYIEVVTACSVKSSLAYMLCCVYNYMFIVFI